MKPHWSKLWLYGWAIILSLLLIYEGVAFILEMNGVYAFPTLSSIIVGLVPLSILEPLTLAVALVLCWHWVQVKKRGN